MQRAVDDIHRNSSSRCGKGQGASGGSCAFCEKPLRKHGGGRSRPGLFLFGVVSLLWIGAVDVLGAPGPGPVRGLGDGNVPTAVGPEGYPYKLEVAQPSSGGRGRSLDPRVEQDAKAKGLAFYEKKTGKKGAEARVTDFGCHVQVDILDGGEVVLSLTYARGLVREI